MFSKNSLRIFATFILGFVLNSFGAEQVTRSVLHNPYQDVDWETFEHHRTCLHIHTRESDGHLPPKDTVKEYVAAGYSILALTDHDTMRSAQTTWPWSDYGIDLDAFENAVLPVQGNEISRPHHIGSYFIEYGAPEERSEEVVLTEIGSRGGLAVMFHPGRYSHPPSWYVELYRRFDHLVGMEVYNQVDRYPQDRAMYDAVLAELMPSRPMWAFANDDYHRDAHFGISFTMFLLPPDGLEEDNFRQAMLQGHFFAVYDPSRDASGMILPRAVKVSESDIKITADAPDEAVAWISHGCIIHRGKRLPLTLNLGNYVRAVIEGADGAKTLVQPFALSGGEAMTTSKLVVENGEGTGEYIEGAMNAPVRAGEAPEGKVFDRWTTEEMARIEDPLARETAVNLQGADKVRVVATFRPPRTYDVTVENGLGGGTALEEATHRIQAEIPEGMAFDYWSGDTDLLDGIWSSVAELTMPARPVAFRAHFTESYTSPPELVNTGFEAGLEGWKADPDVVRILDADDGTRYLRIPEASGARRLISGVPVSPEERLTLIFDARLDRDDVGAPVGFIIQKQDGSGVASPAQLRVSGTEWRPYALSTVMGSDREFEEINIDFWIWVPRGRELDVRNLRVRIH